MSELSPFHGRVTLRGCAVGQQLLAFPILRQDVYAVCEAGEAGGGTGWRTSSLICMHA
jgi:hypothetical protein